MGEHAIALVQGLLACLSLPAPVHWPTGEGKSDHGYGMNLWDVYEFQEEMGMARQPGST
jgi:hypothetical protein